MKWNFYIYMNKNKKTQAGISEMFEYSRQRVNFTRDKYTCEIFQSYFQLPSSISDLTQQNRYNIS